MAMSLQQITLDEGESLLRQCLIDCRDQLPVESGCTKLELRFAGGWVRDKLLGKKSHDIDVALSNMTGLQFGQAMKSFVMAQGSRYEAEATRLQLPSTLRSLHQIAANPEKSKHLETITTKMFGFEVDFVNLRKETYSEDSRNPQMEFGTPEEDALRRDATINALFYNLDTSSIEDYTKQGVKDMELKLMRTPLQPYQTFKDDPLRVLRLIRFASRLGFDIVPDCKEAMKDEIIHEALRAKISRERVGVEVAKMLSGPDPYRALMMIQDLGLYRTVFANPAVSDCPSTDQIRTVYDALSAIISENSTVTGILDLQKEQENSWYLAAYTPWRASAADAVSALRTGIKATNSLTKLVSAAITNRQEIQAMTTQIENGSVSRGRLALILRKFGPAWRLQVLFAMLCELENQSHSRETTSRYETAIRVIRKWELLDATKIKPIIDGEEVRRALDAKGGEWLRRALDMIIEWQLNNSNPTKEKALEIVAEKRAELGLG